MSNHHLHSSPKVSFQYDHNLSSTKKLSETEDCKSIQSRPSDLASVDLSMFSTSSNANTKRVHEIMPKGKPNLNSKNIKKISCDLTESQDSQNIREKSQSIQYSSIKPFFNWKKFTPLCGF